MGSCETHPASADSDADSDADSEAYPQAQAAARGMTRSEERLLEIATAFQAEMFRLWRDDLTLRRNSGSGFKNDYFQRVYDSLIARPPNRFTPTA